MRRTVSENVGFVLYLCAVVAFAWFLASNGWLWVLAVLVILGITLTAFIAVIGMTLTPTPRHQNGPDREFIMDVEHKHRWVRCSSLDVDGSPDRWVCAICGHAGGAVLEYHDERAPRRTGWPFS